MKHTRNILLSCAVILGFAACSSDDSLAPVQNDGSGSPVVLSATVGEGSMFTRSNPDAFDEEKQKEFNIGDVIHVSDKFNHAEGNYILGENGWTAVDANSVLKWESKKDNYFEAWYPAEGNNMGQRHVKKDQSVLDSLRASDVMTYEEGNIAEPDNHVLTMEFTRWTARVVVDIANYRDQYTAEANPVTALTVNGCVVSNIRGEEKADVKAYKVPGETQRFVALVLFTAQDDDATFLTLKVKNGKGEDELTVKGIPTLESGNSYNVKLVIGKDKAEVASVTVNKWTEGSEIPGGEATDKAARTVSLNLAELTGENSLEAMRNWLNTNIGDQSGYTLVLTGELNSLHRQAICSFCRDHENADLTLDLSGVTNLANIDNYAFNLSYSRDHSVGLTGLILPANVTSIGKSAFENTGLKSIDLPEGITSIGASAFQGTNITTLTVPSTLTIVSDNAFESIENLKEIRFNGDVTQMLGTRTFGSDSNLRAIYLNNCTTAPIVQESTFYGLDEGQPITVYVKDESVKSAFEANREWNSHGFTFEVAK